MARHGLTDITIRSLRPKASRYEVSDPQARGLRVVVHSSGRRTFILRYRFAGIQRKLSFESGITLAAARREAAAALYEVEQGRDPSVAKKDAKERARQKAAAAAANSLQAISEEYLRREGGKLRSVNERVAVLRRAILPVLGARQIDTIRRGEIVRLLDQIEDERGPTAADRALAVLGRVMNWYATRDDDFRSPIVRGMTRTRATERARTRILTDAELSCIWRTASEQPAKPFSVLVRFLLTTCARRCEASAMQWDELDGTTWVLPAARNKTKVDLARPLSGAAQRVLAELPHIVGCPYVFSTNGVRPFAGFSKAKKGFDAACGVTGWTLHDCRRTARSLMSRAGVNADIGERCLGHVIGGVRGVYDQYEYHSEKLQAFEKLAALLEQIVHPQENVVVERSISQRQNPDERPRVNLSRPRMSSPQRTCTPKCSRVA
jgi:integrase